MLKNIWNGISSYFSALKLLNTLRLWKYFTIPILISILTGLLIILSAYSFYESIGNKIALLWPFDWAKETVSDISHIIGALLILALGLVLFKHLIMAFSAPFMGPVSEKIEQHLRNDKPVKTANSLKSFSSALARGLKINIRNLIKEILFVIPLLILSLIPVIGILFSILIFLVQAYYAGFGNMDYTLERHFNYKESIAFVKNNRGLAIGNGIGFMLLLLIPVIGIIIVFPLSVVAATTATLKQLNQPN